MGGVEDNAGVENIVAGSTLSDVVIDLNLQKHYWQHMRAVWRLR